MDHEALMDGATNLYAVHISCERKAYQQRNSRASARAEPRKPKVARAELEAAFERAKEEL
jgi:hypothetical protein